MLSIGGKPEVELPLTELKDMVRDRGATREGYKISILECILEQIRKDLKEKMPKLLEK